jgi:hypothetical protein
MGLRSAIVEGINRVLSSTGYELRKDYPDVLLHQYSSYEEYRATQVFHNKRKVEKVWADESTLDLVVDRVVKEFGRERRLFALCHGSRNGFEQNYISTRLDVEILGTDISDTATDYPKSVQWDFHDRREEWVGKCDFVYTNALDQSWKPQAAVATWLEQLKVGGLLFIEHSEHNHGPRGASSKDPFGAKPHYMPYLLCQWFSHGISTEIIETVKGNKLGGRVFLFVVRKL